MWLRIFYYFKYSAFNVVVFITDVWVIVVNGKISDLLSSENMHFKSHNKEELCNSWDSWVLSELDCLLNTRFDPILICWLITSLIRYNDDTDDWLYSNRQIRFPRSRNSSDCNEGIETWCDEVNMLINGARCVGCFYRNNWNVLFETTYRVVSIKYSCIFVTILHASFCSESHSFILMCAVTNRPWCNSVDFCFHELNCSNTTCCVIFLFIYRVSWLDQLLV